MFKFPRTRHVRGSRFQNGDADLEAVPWDEIRGKNIVVEEKIDASQAGISFEEGELKIQSRGHYLRGGPRERQYDLLKQWTTTYQADLYDMLGEQYIMFGEWMYAKHTCFYDALPHYFMEFDVYDKTTGEFLDTKSRDLLLRHVSASIRIEPVHVITTYQFKKLHELTQLVGKSVYRTPGWREALKAHAFAIGQKPEFVISHTDMSDDAEGLYLKWEEDGCVKGRYKFVRSTFTNSIMDQETHWQDRTIVPNLVTPTGTWMQQCSTVIS
jgi:hypothetical protein